MLRAGIAAPVAQTPRSRLGSSWPSAHELSDVQARHVVHVHDTVQQLAHAALVAAQAVLGAEGAAAIDAGLAAIAAVQVEMAS